MKRILSLTLVMTMIISAMFSAIGFANSISFTDVSADTPYQSAIYDLVTKGIIDGYIEEDGTRTFKPDATITRAEFAKLLVVAVTNGVALTSTTTSFADVNQDVTVGWAIPYIAYATSAGIINGYEDGTFRAHNQVTYAEAVKMIVCAKGYGSVIEPTNPWYQGYLTMGNSLGVTKSAVALAEKPAPRGLVAQLIYNMTGINNLISGLPSIGGETGGGFTDNSSSTAVELAGIVTGVGQYTLTGDSANLSNNQIQLVSSGYTYKFNVPSSYNMESLKSYLGHYVNITYDDTTSTNVKNINTITGANTTTTFSIDDEDFVAINGTKIEYYARNNRTTTLTLSNGYNLIYNGEGVGGSVSVAEKNALIALLDGSTGLTGEINFLDSEGDGVYDVVFLDMYETYFVSSYASQLYTIYDNLAGKNIVLDDSLKEIEFKKKTTSGYTDATFDNIARNNIVSVAKTYDNEKYTVLISSATANSSKNAEVTGISSKNVITIGTTDYDLSNYYSLNVANDPSNTKEQAIEYGTKGIFYLDFEGKIAAIDVATTTDEEYGYVISYGSDSLTQTAKLRIRTSSGTKTYTLANKVSLDGTNVSGTSIASALSSSAGVINAGKTDGVSASYPYSQIIKFDTNSSGEINSISTVGDGSTGSISADKLYTDTSYKYEKTSTGFKLVGSSNVSFRINSSTIVVGIPDNRDDNDKYQFLKSGATSFFTNGSNYKIDAYDVKNNVAKVVVVYGSTNAINSSTPTYLVSQVEPALNKDNETSIRLYFQKIGGDGTVDSKVATQSSIVSSISEGDIVKFTLDTNEEINEAELIYDYSNETFWYLTDENGLKSQSNEQGGYVVNIANGTNNDAFNIYKGTVVSKESGIEIAYADVDSSGNLDTTNTQIFSVNVDSVKTHNFDPTRGQAIGEDKVYFVQGIRHITDFETAGSTTPDKVNTALVIRTDTSVVAIVIY